MTGFLDPKPMSRNAADATYAKFAVDTDFTAGVKDRGQRLFQVREAPLTPYQFGATTPVGSTTNNTTALAAMFTAAATATNPEIRLPPGIWLTTGATAGNFGLVNDLKVIGSGRNRSELRIASSSGRPLFTWNTDISGVEMNTLYLNTGSGASDLFAPGASGGIHAATFRNMFINQQIPGKRIWIQDNAASFIHVSFEDVEMQHTTGATVSPFHVRSSGGAANFNLFKQVRINGYNNVNVPFFYFESSLAQTYLTDWVFINLLGEQNPGGMIHAKAALNWTIINATDEDATVDYAKDLFKFEANAAGLASRDLTFIGCGRRGRAMAAGAYEFNIATNGNNITLVNCNPTPTSQNTKAILPATTTVIGGRGYPQQLQGAGSPEGVVTAVPGSQWLRTDGGAGTSFYVKEIGTAATGWVAK